MDSSARAASSSEPALVVFDDSRGSFGPLTDLRAAFELRAGLGTLLERIEARIGRKAASLQVEPRIAAVVSERLGRPVNQPPSSRTVHLVNGRLLDPSCAAVGAGEVVATPDGVLVAASVASEAAGDLGALAARATRVSDAPLARAPWDLTGAIGSTLDADLGLFAAGPRRSLRPDEGQSFGTHVISIDPTATIGPFAVIDASKGPVVIGRGVVVRPFAVIVGPCAVLDGSTVAERSLLKAATVIGPHCRAGGEIGGTIFQGYSNKSHDGHLGDSFVGEWVNIGAGTDNSNLLNTYGEVIVRLEPDGGLVRTGRQFWGSVLGDHVKLAIGTRLMTGTTVGTGAMIAVSRSPSSIVPRFAWLVDGADGAKTFRFEKFMETARAMMSRRGQAPGPALEAALRTLHARHSGA